MKSYRLVAAFLCVMLAGCLPVTTKTPVGTTAGLGSDAALYGTWKGRSPDDKDAKDAYLHFMKGKDGAITALIAYAQGGSDDGWTAFKLHTATLGANRFMNAVETFDGDAPANDEFKNANIPLLYKIEGRTLTVYLFDEDQVKAAIKAGVIAGTVAPGNYGDVTITADAAALDAWLARPEAAKMFKAFLVMKRTE